MPSIDVDLELTDPPSIAEVERALNEDVRPALSVHVGSVELVEVRGTKVHLRLLATCATCYFRRGCAVNLVVPAVETALPGVTCVVDNARSR